MRSLIALVLLVGVGGGIINTGCALAFIEHGMPGYAIVEALLAGIDIGCAVVIVSDPDTWN